MAGVWLPRAVVNARIEARLTEQMDAGFLDEVATLADRPAKKECGGMSRTARQALGYRELLGHLDGKTTLDDAVEETVRRTRAFARRQRAWFRRDPRITWLATAGNPLDLLPALLRSWST